MKRHVMPCLALIALLVFAVARLRAAESAPLPSKLGELLRQAQEDLRSHRADQAVEGLEGYRGDDHPLRQLLLGHAYREQQRRDAAAAAYRRALELDQTLEAARQGLAQIYVQQENWPQAVRILGQFVDPRTTEGDWLVLYAQAALELADHRLAKILVEAGLSRFPADQRLRQLDLARLIKAGEFQQARNAAWHLLLAEPGNPQMWERYAAVSAQAKDEQEPRIALEAALLADPDNLERHRQFLSALLLAGDWLTAVEHGNRLLDGPFKDRTVGDVTLMELLIRAADEGEKDELLARWVELVDAGQRTQAMRLAAARSALRQGQTDRAREALGRLIVNGQSDAAIFLQAGFLAEQAGATAEAEAHYLEAAKLSDAAARLSPLYLARLYHRLGRAAEAASVLKSHLDKEPTDAAARALLTIVQQAAEKESR